MVRFGLKLEQESKQEWADMYIDYSRLKAQLKGLQAKSSSGQAITSQTHAMSLLDLEFSKQMDDEIEKVVLFFLTKQGELAARLQAYRQSNIRLEAQTVNEMEHLIAMYRTAGDEIIGGVSSQIVRAILSPMHDSL